MADYTIIIQCDQGNFTYIPATQRVDRGKCVEWRSDIPFIVSFGERTPFDELELQPNLDAAEHITVGKEVIGEPGIYRYAVAVFKENRVWIDHCPEIKIGRK
jgi:hypothetical protein